jgi:hypothetical protein
MITQHWSTFVVGVSLMTQGIVSSQANAHEHAEGKISGARIELAEKNHAFAGAIDGNPVFGAFTHEPFSAEFVLRKGESTLRMALVDRNDTYQGAIQETVTGPEGQVRVIQTQVAWMGVRKTGEKTGTIRLTINGEPVDVSVVGESFQNNHFQSPKFKATVRGQEITFSFSGEACFAYSSNLAMMILAAKVHSSIPAQ